MHKAIELAKIISKNNSVDATETLKEYNLFEVFGSVYTLDESIENKNRIICLIIYGYSAESNWLNLKQDRIDNKAEILRSLGADLKYELFDDVLNNRNEIVGISLFNYLEQIKSWKWKAIFNLLDYSSKMFRFANQETETERTYEKLNKEGETKSLTQEINIEIISKVNKEKGILLENAISKRKQADELLGEIEKDYVNTDNATQSEFSFKFTDTAKKSDILSWSVWIQSLNDLKKAAV